MEQVFSCTKVSRGAVEGEALVSSEPILFYCVDPATGVVTEEGHCLEGKSLKGKILVCPGGKGSSSVQADGMYRLDRDGTAPLALIVEELDTVLVSSAVVMEMPMVWRVEPGFYEKVRDGLTLRVNTEAGTVTIVE